jgi:hypothetical protein
MASGQVENQVGVMRRRLFVPRPRFKSYAELNAWLEDRCLSYAKANKHPELRDKTIWEVFEGEPCRAVANGARTVVHWARTNGAQMDDRPIGNSERHWRTRPRLVPYTGPFDGFHAVAASVSKSGAPPVKG